MAVKRAAAGAGKVYKHHKNDRCFRCRERFEAHGHAKDKKGQVCKEFEYVPPTARNQADVLFSAPFQSESSANIWVVKAWRHGDYSCNCVGWRNHRTCDHCNKVAANPDKYKGKQADAINGGAGSVLGIKAELDSKMKAAEEAVKRGDTIELDRLQAEIEMNRDMLLAAGGSLDDGFQRMRSNIHEHVYGDVVKTAQPAPVPTPAQASHVVNPDDPFAD